MAGAKLVGPIWLRRREGGAEPVLEQFADLDAALDAVVARWDALQHQAPQVLDGRRVLVASTEELREIVAEERAGQG